MRTVGWYLSLTLLLTGGAAAGAGDVVCSHVAGGNTVGGELRERTPRPDGYCHIDTPGTIARLRELHANNVNYLIWNSPTDWDDLRNEFLPAVQRAGITVWAYLAPPAETYSKGKGSDPFRTDYLRWAEELARLSKQYPALQAWVMDDFTWNMKTFTAEYVRKLQETAHAINPDLRFIPVIHFTAVTEQWAKDYGPLVDGLMCPYIDLPYNDTQRVSSLDRQIDAARARTDKPLYVLLYAGRHLTSPLEPNPEYVSEAMRVALEAARHGRIGGVVSYATPLDPATPRTTSNRAIEGRGRLSLAAVAARTAAGDFAAASQTVTPDPRSPRYTLSLWHHDQWGPPQYEKGLYKKQVLVDDQVVWEVDPAADIRDTWLEGSILQGPVDLTAALKGKASATLTLRVISTKDGVKPPIDVSFDRLRPTGFALKDPGFETGEGWQFHDAGGYLMAAVDRFDPDAPRHVFDAVAKAYSTYQGKDR